MKTPPPPLTWADVCDDKTLADLPYKIELNRFGQIVMSPRRYDHTYFQGNIHDLLKELLPGGRAFQELGVDTSDGTKEPDVIWASAPKVLAHRGVVSWPEAPEICVEVLSNSNSIGEMDFKRKLYFERGALEVWLCDFDGTMTFFDQSGQIPVSKLCPKFPSTVGP